MHVCVGALRYACVFLPVCIGMHLGWHTCVCMCVGMCATGVRDPVCVCACAPEHPVQVGGLCPS